MREISKRINQTPLELILYFLLLFFLPFQERYHKLIKKFSALSFKGQYLPSFFLSHSLEFYLTDLLMIGILVLSLRRFKPSLFWEQSQKYLTLFLGLSLISIFLSPAAGKIWPYYRWLQLALPISISFALSRKKGMLKTCFWIILVTSILQCIIALDQYLLQHSISLKHLGEQKIAFNFSPEIQVASKERWIFDKWLGIKMLSKHILRPFGTFPHPNILGAFLGMAFFASSYLYLKTKKRWIGPLLSLQLFVLALTYSRAAVFGVTGAFCLLLVLLALAKENWKRLLIPFLVGALFSGVVLKEQYVQRGGIVGRTPSSHVSDSARVAFQKMAFAMAQERPFIGQGYGQYLSEVERFDHTQSPYPMQKVHNIFLLILAESGLLALLAFVGYFLSLLYRICRVGFDLESACCSAILALFLFSGCVDYFWLEVQHGRIMLFALCGLILQQLRIRADLALPTPQSPVEVCSPSC